MGEGMTADLFDRLRKIQLAERRHAILTALEPDLYDTVNLRVAELTANLADRPVEEQREHQNLFKISHDILSRRKQKIVAKAQHDLANSSITSEGLAKEERDFYLSLVGLLKEFDSIVVLSGQAATRQKQDSPQLAGSQEIPPAPEKVRVRMLAEIPEFVSSTLDALGPFGKSEVVELPRTEAELLINRSLASVIEDSA